jgi:cholesterol 7-desaturase
MPENGADFAHLNFLHVPCAVSRALSHIILHRWLGKWQPGEDDDSHHAYLDLHQHMEVRGVQLPGTYVHVDVTQEGPGLVFLRFDTPVGKLIVIETVTPIAPLLQRATHVIYAAPLIPRALAKFVLFGLVVQFERDLPIWNNKTFVPKPLVVEGDGPIAGFRRWYAKFYSESSNKFRGSNDTDW